LRFGTLVLLTLSLAAVMGMIGPGASVEARQSTAPTARAGDDVVGASISHPAGWSVERERYTFDGTYGFTLWRPESDPATHDHGGTPAVRVALAYDHRPGQIEATVRDRLAAYPHLPMSRETVSVGERGRKGVAVGPIPGSTPSTEVYVPVGGRVYQINVYGETLGADGKELLSTLRFEPPSRPVSSLGLPDANAPETLYTGGDPEREQAAHEAAMEGEMIFEASALGRERRIAEGCWRADPDFFFQTQHGPGANGNLNDGIPKGYTIVGKPNYWNEYTHGRLGYGRCTKRVWCNDKFAVDYPLNRGDAVFSPFRHGTVTFAGRNYTHKDYGILVSIRTAGGKYVSLSAHLKALARGIKRGTKVDRHTVIGFAGKTGGGTIPVGRPHLHQAYYRYPSYNRDGSPYGGAGLQVIRHHFFRGNDGVYRFGWKKRSGIKSKGSLISF
jgi:hypothetical protein